jgi:hypothetical protein
MRDGETCRPGRLSIVATVVKYMSRMTSWRGTGVKVVCMTQKRKRPASAATLTGRFCSAFLSGRPENNRPITSFLPHADDDYLMLAGCIEGQRTTDERRSCEDKIMRGTCIRRRDTLPLVMRGQTCSSQRRKSRTKGKSPFQQKSERISAFEPEQS